MMDFVFFAALSLVLGFKHAFDADHLVAVSSFFTRRRGYGAGVGLATAWAAGHLVTAAAISAVLYFFAGTFLPQLIARLDLLVPAMLILVGLLALGFEARRFHVHRHRHQDAGPEHAHPHVHVRGATRHEHGAIAGIGVIHGLASNDELLVVLLVGLGASAWWQVFAGIALFSVGVLVGMIVYAAAVRLVEERFPGRATATALNVTFSVLSIGYGIYLLLGGAGLNLLDRWVGFA
jgi:hypothetical protein